MTVRVKLFGAEARAAGQREISVAISGNSCSELREKIGQQLPQLRELLSKCRFAVNHEFVNLEHQLRESDEIALIGMVSGG
jgi:molybdopterin converting factor small subunit